MKKFEEESILIDAVETFGRSAQIDMCIEECSELIQALCKLKRGRETNVEEEIADCLIMLEQMKCFFDREKVQQFYFEKLERLALRIRNHKLKV